MTILYVPMFRWLLMYQLITLYYTMTYYSIGYWDAIRYDIDEWIGAMKDWRLGTIDDCINDDEWSDQEMINYIIYNWTIR